MCRFLRHARRGRRTQTSESTPHEPTTEPFSVRRRLGRAGLGAAGDKLRAVDPDATRAHRCQDAGSRRRHGQPAGVDAARDPDHTAEPDRARHRTDGERHRCRGRAEVFPEPAGAQALHRRLRPRRARDARLGHRQQRALTRLRRRRVAFEPARQRRELHAALGTGDTGGNRARRRALWPVLGRLRRQLRRRDCRFRDAHAQGL